MAVPRTKSPPRRRTPSDGDIPKPIYAVWELTMLCDQPCEHCGSRAGKPREEELSTEEILEVAESLHRMGTREVALIGGEAYLRKDLPIIVRFLVDRGMRVAMQTGGRALTPERAEMLAEAGMAAVGVSIDGPEPIHDQLRGNRGSYAAALQALDNATAAGMLVTSNAQINRLNYRHLYELADTIREHGAVSWQTALTVPMGEAADRPDWILEPWRVVEVMDTLADIQLKAAAAFDPEKESMPFNVYVSNNIGYFGPHEQVLRSRPGGDDVVWGGCKAGINAIGIESNGRIKGCPSLPSAPYVGGNVRDLSLEQIWEHSAEVGFARNRTLDELWGHCKTCYFAEYCHGGCSWMAHCTLGRRGNNPFCYHRVTTLKKQGIRERLVLKERAPNEPYDFGRFEIVEEPWSDEPEPPPEPKRPRSLPLV